MEGFAMELDRRRQNWQVWGVAIVVSLAVLVGLFFKGLSGATASDAIKDVGAALIPILSAFVTARLVLRQMDPAERSMRVGEAALRDLQKQHTEVLSGPKANREDYDPENPGKAGRYLFFQLAGQRRKAQFIPVLPLQDGIVEIRVPKTTVLLLGADQSALDAVQREVLASTRAAVENLLRREWPKSHEVLVHKHPDIAIAVDLDEAGLSPKRYQRAVTMIGNAALEAMRKSR
jgi:hypothetical protein